MWSWHLLMPLALVVVALLAYWLGARRRAGDTRAHRDARLDPLTGLANRRALDETLARQAALLDRYATPFSVILLDVDHFKRINDQRGHAQGDAALRGVARLLERGVRQTDLATRFGGDEFLIVLPQTRLAGAGIMAERLRRRVERDLGITLSGGVASARADESPAALLARADAALYAAKQAGRNQIHQHDGAAPRRVEPAAPPPEAV